MFLPETQMNLATKLLIYLQSETMKSIWHEVYQKDFCFTGMQEL